jgi:DNA (cytosine-5)-methyltransferase 1
MMALVGSDTSIKSDLNENVSCQLDTILTYAESAKGVLTVILTSLVYKFFNPEQDIRLHQSSIPGGYSGRTFDSKFITPFLKSARFPAMAESGWLTRSLEQKQSYTKGYTGAINPPALKIAFLSVLEQIENGDDPEVYLKYLLQGLIIRRNAHQINLAKPVNLPISRIISLLQRHFDGNYHAEGVSRLPVLALYAAYQCLISENKRYEGKTLVPIESHTSADRRSGRIGDIEVIDANGKPFEAVEVKHGIPITAQLIEDAYEKFSTTQVQRYYLLSTADVAERDRQTVNQAIDNIRNIHGCHVIANGLVTSLAYYLRLLTDPAQFIENYVNLIETDGALKFEHKKRWNELVVSF